MLSVSGWAGHSVHRKIPEGIHFIVNSEELPAHYLPPATAGFAFYQNWMNRWNLYGKRRLTFLSFSIFFKAPLSKEAVVHP